MFCLPGGFFSAHSLRRLWLKGAKIQISLNYRSVTLITWHVRSALCTLLPIIYIYIFFFSIFFSGKNQRIFTRKRLRIVVNSKEKCWEILNNFSELVSPVQFGGWQLQDWWCFQYWIPSAHDRSLNIGWKVAIGVKVRLFIIG